MLFLQGQRKAIDDASQDLKQLSNAIMVFCLEDEPVEYVIDSLAHERSMNHELPIYSVQDCLQVVSLPRVLRVKEFQQLQHKMLIYVLLRYFGISVV